MPTLPKSEILKIASLIDYQTDAIVSRQITKTAGGNVTLFAFDEGQELSEHTSPQDAFVHVLEGEVEIIISGNPYNLREGEGIIMPSNHPHSLKAVKKMKMLLTMIHVSTSFS